MDSLFTLPCVHKHMELQNVLKTVPATSKQFFLGVWHFDFSPKSKYGEQGRFPTNIAYKNHFHSFITTGYESGRETVDVRFQHGATTCDDISPFSVQFVDGQNKLLIMQSVIALMENLDPWPEKNKQSNGGGFEVLFHCPPLFVHCQGCEERGSRRGS